jgi:cation:H+ antiporter
MAEWMSLIIQPIILAISLAILIKFSNIVSDSSANLARITGLGEMAVGFLILSIVTSLPELSVSILSVNSGDVEIPIGTVFGSNIANIGLILGLTAVLSPTVIKITREDYRSLSLMLVIASVVPLQILIFGRFTNLIGLMLLAMFIIFSVYSIKSRIPVVKETDEKTGTQRLAKEIAIVLGGVVAILISSQFVVNSSVAISSLLQIDQSVIGATVIAIGTSLPELSVSLAAVKKGRVGLALGNILGSCITNLTLILGFVLVSSHLEVNIIVFAELVVMLVIVNLTLWRFMMDKKITLGNGMILLLLYVIFMASTLGIQIVMLSPGSLAYILSVAFGTILKVLSYTLIGIVALILGWSLGKG